MNLGKCLVQNCEILQGRELVGLPLDTLSPVQSLIQLLMVRGLTGKVNLELDRG